MLDKSFVKISFVKITLSFENALCLKSLDNTDYLEVCLYFNRTFHLLPRLGKLLYTYIFSDTCKNKFLSRKLSLYEVGKYYCSTVAPTLTCLHISGYLLLVMTTYYVIKINIKGRYLIHLGST